MKTINLRKLVQQIESAELSLTVFNSKRALSNVEKDLKVMELGKATLLLDKNSKGSMYYNRVKGLEKEDLDRLDDILQIYRQENIWPCFDLTPFGADEEVVKALFDRGYYCGDKLVFMKIDLPDHMAMTLTHEMEITSVTNENAKSFIRLIMASNGGMDLSDNVIDEKSGYFYKPHFKNYIAHLSGVPAGIGSLYLEGDHGYIANDFTFENFRNKGIQRALITHRMEEAKKMGITQLYTDVEFGSVSHKNMLSMGFETIYINSFYIHADD